MAQSSLQASIMVNILWFTSDPGTRRAIRAASGSVNASGEAVRLKVIERIIAVDGRYVHTDCYSRMSFWSPWVGRITVKEDLDASLAIRAHFSIEIWSLPGYRRGWLVRSWPPRRQRWVELHGNSDASILFSEHIRGQFRNRYDIYCETE